MTKFLGPRAGPSAEPFDDRYAVWRQVGFQAGSDDLIDILKAVKIQVIEFRGSFVFTNERKCG